MMTDAEFLGRFPPLSLREDEVEAIQQLIAQGELPRDAFKRHRQAMEKVVYGDGAPKDAKGAFIEQGIGSAAQPSRNSVEAYRKNGKEEAGYEKNLAKMERDLADFQARRRAERANV
jgi:hypothetical protein